MEIQLVVFRVAGEEYGLPIDQVREINRYAEITVIPKAPKITLGVINLRGNVIPVFSLRRLLGFSDEGVTEATRIVISEIRGQTAGLVVDSVTEVLLVDESLIQREFSALNNLDAGVISGVAKVKERLVIILKAETVIDLAVIQHLAKPHHEKEIA